MKEWLGSIPSLAAWSVESCIHFVGTERGDKASRGD